MRAAGAQAPASAPAPKAPPPSLDLEEAWAGAAALFANRRGMRVSRTGFFGVPSRLLPDRVAQVIGAPGAKRARHLLGFLSDGDLRVFHARAAINLEQAVAGARASLVFNVSAPVAFLVLLNTILPGSIAETYFSDPVIARASIAALGLFGIVILLIVWYAFAGAQQARDLYHLATLEMARRGVAATLAGGDQNTLEAKL